MAALIVLIGIAGTVASLDPRPQSIAEVSDNLRHVFIMVTTPPRNFGAILPAFAIAISAWWFGQWLAHRLKLTFKHGFTATSVSLVLGCGFWTIASVLIGAAGLLYGPVMWTMAAAGCILACIRGLRWYDSLRARGESVRIRFSPSTTILFVLAAFTMWIALLGALEPEVGYDARHYHLADALRYAQHHRIYNLVAAEHTFVDGLAKYQEDLSGAAVAMGGLPAAKTTAWLFGFVAYLAVVGITLELWGSAGAAALAGLLFVNTPIVVWAFTTESTDVPLVPYSIIALLILKRWYDSGARRWLVVSGALCGIAAGIKIYGAEFGFCLALLIGLTTYLRSRGLPPAGVRKTMAVSVGLFTISACATALGWLIQSGVATNDPVFPVAYQYFHTPFSTPEVAGTLAAAYKQYGSNIGWYGILAAPFLLTYQTNVYRDFIGPVFLVGVPIVILSLITVRRRDYTYIALLAVSFLGLLLLFIGGTVSSRYITWGLATGSTLIAVACVDLFRSRAHIGLRMAAPAVILLASLSASPLLFPLQRNALAGQSIGQIYLNWDYLYGDLPADSIQLVYMPMLKYMNEHLPPSSKVFDGADLVVFNSYSNIELFNGAGFDSPSAEGQWNLYSADSLAMLQSNHITHVVVYGNALDKLRASPLWSHLHEIDQEPDQVHRSNSPPDPALRTVLFEVR